MRQTFLKKAVLVLTVPILFSSCATIFGKSSYPVSINTNPSGATVSITDKKSKEVYKGTTPATVTLKSGAGYFSKAEYQVKLSSPGFAEQIIPVNYKLNGWYFGNILLGGVIGMLIVDPATGAMWKLDTPPINVTLAKSTASASEPTLKIMDIKDVPESMKLSLVKLK
jgi:PEGA domain